jgi:hypothetical protein
MYAICVIVDGNDNIDIVTLTSLSFNCLSIELRSKIIMKPPKASLHRKMNSFMRVIPQEAARFAGVITKVVWRVLITLGKPPALFCSVGPRQ